MKKLLAILLSVIILSAAVPFGVYAAEEDTALTGSYVVSDSYFAPITVSGDRAYQAGQELDTVNQNGTLLVDVEAVAASADVTDDGEVTLPTEDGAITLEAGSDTAQVFREDGGDTVVLEAAPVQQEETLYAPLDSLAALCNIEVTQDGGTVVYSMPFQTKNLIVRGSRIPDCGEESRTSLDGGYIMLHFETESATQEAYDTLSRVKTVSEVSGENIYSVYELTADDFALGENLSWGADYIDSQQLTEYVKERHITASVTVGIVDTGINTGHSLYKDRIDSKSHSCVASEPEVEDKEGHGSHVAGIVADNTPDSVKILAVKGLDKEGRGTDSNLAAAIRYAADNGADIINMSFGGSISSVGSILKNAVKYAYDKGVVLVAAAGNEDSDASRSFPSASPYVITVAATDVDGDPAYFSNYGTAVDVAAPGVNIYSAYKNEGTADAYIRESGTSMASPFVAAACADAMLFQGKLMPDAMKAYVKSKVTPYGKSSRYYGTGIISLTDYIGVTRSEPVIFSKASGSYGDALTVTLSCADSGAKIYYTTDGSAPDNTASLYTGALTVSENTEIKAAAYSGSLYKSKTTKASYRFNAYDFDSNYIIDDNGVITAYRGEMEALSVQDVISGKRVTGISPSAFRDNNVVELNLPDAVTEIPDSAFLNCTLLERITARGVTKVGNNAFYNCSLEHADFGTLQEVGKYAFYGNRDLGDDGIDLSALTEVPDYAFYQCGLTLLGSDKITTLGKNCFAYTNLLTVSLPQVKTVSEGAFGQCRALETVSLPNAEVLAKNAFRNCHKLAQFTGDKLTVIGESAFDSCYPLSSLTTSGVHEIGANAFAGTAIEVLDLPLVTSLPDYAFYFMQHLRELTLGDVRTVSAYAFNHTEALTAIPDGVKNAVTVEHNAFQYSGIAAVDLPRAVSVKEEAFGNTPNLSAVSLPSCVTFGMMREMGGTGFTALNLPSVIHFGAVQDSLFLQSVSLPLATSVQNSAFNGCVRLKSVLAPNVEALPSFTFSGCASLTDLQLGSVKGQLGTRCFEGCASIKEICLPDVTEMVGGNTFRNCTSLELIDLSSARKVGAMNDDFYGCESLKYIISPNAEQVNGVEFYHGYALREWNLPKCKNLSFAAYNSVNNNRDMDFVADVSIHAPKAEYLCFRDDTTYLSGYAIPAGVKSVSMNNKNMSTPKTLAFYSSGDISGVVKEGVNYTLNASPCIADDLPESYTLTSGAQPLQVSAFCADPVYTWYYAADGAAFTALSGETKSRLYPEKAGAYYCRVTENGTDSFADSAVCQVCLDGVTAVLKNSTGETVNILCNGSLFEQITTGESLRVPVGAAVRILAGGSLHSLTVGSTSIYKTPNTFDLTVSGNAELKGGRELQLKDADISLGTNAGSIYYTASPIVPVPLVTIAERMLKKGTDYTVTVVNNIEGGTATVIITGIGNVVGTRSINFTIRPESVSSCTVTPIPTQAYTGSALMPPVELKLNGKTVTDYRITGYKNNVEAGTATVTIIGGGTSLIGTRNITFTIARSLGAAVLTVTPAEMTYTGSALTPAVTVTLGGTVLKQGTDYTVQYQNNTAVGTGVVKVTGIGSYYGTASTSFTIKAAPKAGWQKENGKWLYYENGAAVKGWKKISGKWYYFSADGVMQTGWQKIGGKWYYMNSSGAMLTGWQKIGGKWYYFNASGAMLTGWQKIGGKWYYFNASGAMLTGWQKIGGKWYYFESGGAMLANTSKKIGSKTYKFNASGVCTNP